MKPTKTEDLPNLNNPQGGDLIPTLDIDGGAGGKPKLKKLALAKLFALLSASVTGLLSQEINYVSGDYFNLSESWQFSLSPGKLSSLLKISVDAPSRVRFYASDAARTADYNRGTETEPDNNTGLVFEGIFIPSALTIELNPIAWMFSQSGQIYATVQPYNVAPQPLNLTVSIVPILV